MVKELSGQGSELSSKASVSRSCVASAVLRIYLQTG
jgi:hypothetical protein